MKRYSKNSSQGVDSLVTLRFTMDAKGDVGSMKTVKEVSQLAGISIRTLRYYDEVGLLKPTQVSEAGYRLYDDKALERLQEIMFFKEMEIPLEQIKQIVEDPTLDRQEVLLLQKGILEKKRNRLNGLIELIEDVSRGVNTMSFEAFSEEDISRIVEHTLSHIKPELLQQFTEKYGGLEAIREEMSRELKDPETEAHLIKLYGGKEKAITVSLSGTGSMDEITKYQKETDEIYRQFAEAMKFKDEAQKKDAVRRLAESSKAMWHIENTRYYLLRLAETFGQNGALIKATDEQYGEGVVQYMVEAIREYYGVE